MLLDGQPHPPPYLPSLPDRPPPDLRQAPTIDSIGTPSSPTVFAPPAVAIPKRRGRVAFVVLVVLALLGGVGFYLLRASGRTSAVPAVTPTVTAAKNADLFPIETASFSFALPSRPVIQERPKSSAGELVPTSMWTIQIDKGTLQVIAFPASAAVDGTPTPATMDRVVSRLVEMSGSDLVVSEPDSAVSPSARRIVFENATSRSFVEVLSMADWIVVVSQAGDNHEITPAYTAVLDSFRFHQPFRKRTDL